jgi:hypothetical protein
MAQPAGVEEEAPVTNDPAAAAVHWEAVAKRTRSVSEQWRTLHASEEARANEAKATAKAAVQALRRAEEERDAAEKKAAAASKALAAAKGEQTRWKARSEAQTASKTYLQLEECRAALVQRDAELADTSRALSVLRSEFDAYKASRKRHDRDLSAATHERVEGLLQQREDATAAARNQEGQADALRAQLTSHLASSPPGGLEAAQLANKRAAAAIQQLEQKNMTLRREVLRWRDRAKGALASERLLALHKGPGSVPRPTSGAVPGRFGGDPFGESSESERIAEEFARLRAECSYWREEAEHEKQRQRAFHEALWQSPAFSQAQKLKAMACLREPPGLQLRGSEDNFADDAFFAQLPNPPDGPPTHGYGMAPHARRPVTVPTGAPKPLFAMSPRQAR